MDGRAAIGTEPRVSRVSEKKRSRLSDIHHLPVDHARTEVVSSFSFAVLTDMTTHARLFTVRYGVCEISL